MPVLPALAGMVGIVISAVVTYLVGRRSKTGRVATSEAADLWNESKAMRQELREEAASLRSGTAVLVARVEALELENADLRRRLKEAGL